MKKFIKKITHTAKSAVTCVKTAAVNSMSAVLAFNRRAVCGNAGEGYIDTAVKVLIAVVLGALVLAGLYAILNDKQRRITNISECEILPDGSRRLHKLYEYHITDNHLEDDHFIIEGEHRKCEEISESLRRRFIENGMPLGELAQFVQGKEEDE